MGGGASKKKQKPSEPVDMTLAMHTDLGVISLKLRRSYLEAIRRLFWMEIALFSSFSSHLTPVCKGIVWYCP